MPLCWFEPATQCSEVQPATSGRSQNWAHDGNGVHFMFEVISGYLLRGIRWFRPFFVFMPILIHKYAKIKRFVVATNNLFPIKTIFFIFWGRSTFNSYECFFFVSKTVMRGGGGEVFFMNY